MIKYYESVMKVLEDSVESIQQDIYEKLVNECVLTKNLINTVIFDAILK
ncbi:hypothetical protein [Oribacterium sp. C9]|nr:hypothetical protein [Oribacterium sp. C9]